MFTAISTYVFHLVAFPDSGLLASISTKRNFFRFGLLTCPLQWECTATKHFDLNPIPE
jgi:hypothetical protein